MPRSAQSAPSPRGGPPRHLAVDEPLMVWSLPAVLQRIRRKATNAGALQLLQQLQDAERDLVDFGHRALQCIEALHQVAVHLRLLLRTADTRRFIGVVELRHLRLECTLCALCLGVLQILHRCFQRLADACRRRRIRLDRWARLVQLVAPPPLSGPCPPPPYPPP